MVRLLISAIVSGVITAIVFYVLGLILVQIKSIDFLVSIGNLLLAWYWLLGILAFLSALLGLRGRV